MYRYNLLRPHMTWGLDFWHSPWLMGIGVLLVAAVITLAVVLIVKSKKRKEHESDSALALLKSNYVSGEITEEEYLKKKEILKH